MKIISMYLPQFHRTPENDEWWGEGFTEWTSVKKATSLFEGHSMPREPKDDNYYNLLDKSTMQWQADLMHKYGVYGMCFYHYYFKDGRKILEKPAENLLKWKDIDMQFCFSWANETWARSWSKLSLKNVWSLENDDSNRNGDGILLQQSYGNKGAWIEHFEYLLPFFKDERYIKIDGKPLFLIYKTEEIYCLEEMLETWNGLAIKYGFDGIYVVSTNDTNTNCNANVNMEPQYSLRRFYSDKYRNVENKVTSVIDYSEIAQKSYNAQKVALKDKKNSFLSAFPSYDDTPRRSTAGIAIINSSPDSFKEYLKDIVKLSMAYEKEYVFINAWNEWGETMYLEPDKQWQYGYLAAIKEVLEESEKYELNHDNIVDDNDAKDKIDRTIAQYRSYWKLFDKWLTLKERNISISDYLHDNRFLRIAIYGLGMIGNHLLVELENSDISIEYGIDGKGQALNMEFPVYTLNDELPDVECVIVTVTYDYHNIKTSLVDKGLKNIKSLESIIGELLEKDNIK